MVVLYYGIAAVLALVMTGESTVLWVYSMLFALVYGAAAAAVPLKANARQQKPLAALAMVMGGSPCG